MTLSQRPEFWIPMILAAFRDFVLARGVPALREFVGDDDLNAQALRWLEDVANVRPLDYG